MKKMRRIEITAFRRRTTIVLPDKPEGGPAASAPPPVGCGDASRLSPTDSPRTGAADLGRPQAAETSPGSVSTA
ncbi:MAG: hypothetical protein ACRD68_09765, partial [Pyrinomonadaceae bacterium]